MGGRVMGDGNRQRLRESYRMVVLSRSAIVKAGRLVVWAGVRSPEGGPRFVQLGQNTPRRHETRRTAEK